MKVMPLLVSFIILSLSAMAQSELELALLKERQNKNNFLFPTLKKHIPFVTYGSATSQIKKLALDNMPCLIGDISIVAPIPTLTFDPRGQTIPNPFIKPGLSPADPK